MSPPTEVVPYDPAWPQQAAVVIAAVTTALADTVSAVEHIGSTAVPGLAAKPVIDVMAAAPDPDAVEQRTAALAAIGLDAVDSRMPRRLMFRAAASEGPAVHLHVVDAASWPTRNQRLLRDFLRRHPESAARYGALKTRLAGTAESSDAYTAAKTALIQELTDAARAEVGLPPAPVWEE